LEEYSGVIDLAAIRRATRQTQVELAANFGVGQAQVSKFERQSDMLLTTLASYLSALGVRAALVIEVDGRTEKYDLTAMKGDR
jgi:transcriptional regulator with XRE-family HTH domain